MKQETLFKDISAGAVFSKDRKYRYSLWRIWNTDKPLMMVIGLNPSKADENILDNTTKKIAKIADYNGFGGFYMMNCFAYVSTDPAKLIADENDTINMRLLKFVSKKCQDVVFAWGDFKIISHIGISNKIMNMFPEAKALDINKSGSPKHPLYCKIKTKLINYY